MIFLLLHNMLYSCGVYDKDFGYNEVGSILYSYSDSIKQALNILLFRSNERLLGGYWFLPSLFMGSILFYIALKISNKVHFCVLGGGNFTDNQYVVEIS